MSPAGKKLSALFLYGRTVCGNEHYLNDFEEKSSLYERKRTKPIRMAPISPPNHDKLFETVSAQSIVNY